jgi:2-oxoglutarate/2-oxoacid ferredoxin oxidoreductase subunit alpha
MTTPDTRPDATPDTTPDAAPNVARTSICLAILGSGGAGSLTTAGLLLEAAGRCGWYGLMTRSVGPQIRGGEAAAFVRLAASGAALVEVEMKALAREIPGGRPNMIALGLAAGLVGIPEDELDRVIVARLAAKGEAAMEASRSAVAAGIEQSRTLGRPIGLATSQAPGAPRWSLTGNEATGLGAVRGGVRFAAAYPITPATEILEWLAPALTQLGGVLVQAEDELASVNMIIGASYGGTPALTATSGPGLALMVEALGLACAAEIPVVVVNVMRAGPSTGIPTKSEQADLNIAVYGCHGDAPHVVVAPLSVADCLFTTQWAVHLAESMQTPAIVLSDQFLGQTQAVIEPPATVSFLTKRKTAAAGQPEAYRRYARAAGGVSPMAIPGMSGGQYTADGLTHDEKGTPSSRTGDHMRQLDKRHDKVEGFEYGSHWADVQGDGEFVLLTWGSLSGAAQEAAQRLAGDGIAVRTVSVRLIAPLKRDRLSEALGTRKVLVIEQSHSGQFERYLRSHALLGGAVRTLRRPGPLPIRPGEICSAIHAWRQS